MNLAERLEAAFEHGKSIERFSTWHEWAEAANVSLNYLTTKRAVLKKKPNAKMMGEEGHKLANAAGVSPKWLINGEGTMLLATEASNRQLAARNYWLAQESQQEHLDEAKAFLRETDGDAHAEMSDASADMWLAHYAGAFREWRRKRKTGDVKGISLVTTTTDGPPIANRRKR